MLLILDNDNKYSKLLCSIVIIFTIVICSIIYIKHRPNAYEIKVNDEHSFEELNNIDNKPSEDKAVSANKVALAPPCEGIVTSKFGIRSGKMHKGIDIANNSGSPIYAALDGVVTYSGWMEGYGNVVKIDHSNGVETLYAHCKLLRVKVGDTVKQGQLIADMGSTGRSTGPHVHFEVRVNGENQNPANYI